MDIWAWLNANSATATATVVTALATAVIAWATCVNAGIVSLEKQIEKANREPVLTVFDMPTGNCRSLRVRNIGYGPALNIVCQILNPGSQAGSARPPLRVGSIGPKENADAHFATQPGSDSTPLTDNPYFHAVIEFDDVLENHYKIVFRNRSLTAPKPIKKRAIPPSNAELF